MQEVCHLQLERKTDLSQRALKNKKKPRVFLSWQPETMKKPAKTSEAKQKTSSFLGFPEEKCNTPHKRGSRAEKKRKKPRVFEGQRSQSAERVHFAS